VVTGLSKLPGDPEGVSEMSVSEGTDLRTLSELDSQVGPDEHFLGVGESQIPGAADRDSRGGIKWQHSIQSEEPDRAWGLFGHG